MLEKQLSIRVASVNILNEGNIDQRYDFFMQNLAHISLDVIAVQEVVKPELLKNLFIKNGYPYVEYDKGFVEPKSGLNYLLIASKTPLLNSRTEDLSRIFIRSTTIHNKVFHIFNAHFMWGFHNEFSRLEQAFRIDEIASNLENSYSNSVSVLLADCNAHEDSRSMRFLRGLDMGPDNRTSTFWLDAYEVAGVNTYWSTNSPKTNKLAKLTAESVGIKYTHLIPDRRIDYIYVRGWNYGRNCFPIDFGYLRSVDAPIYTDHTPIFSEFLILD